MPAPVEKPNALATIPSTLGTKHPYDCFDDVVNIKIGPEAKVFSVHKSILCQYSSYFNAAFNGSFKEAYDKALPLPDEDVPTFRAYLGFIYFRQIRDSHGNIGDNVLWVNLFKLWIMSDKYLTPLLQNTVMNLLISKSKKCSYLPIDGIDYVYDNTPVGSPLRSFIIDLAAYKGNIKGWTVPGRCGLPDFPREALEELVQVLASLRMADAPENLENKDKCAYHIHATGEHC